MKPEIVLLEFILPSILLIFTCIVCGLIFCKDKDGDFKFFNKTKEESSVENTQDMYIVQKYIDTYETLDDAIHKRNPTDYMLTPGYSFKILKEWSYHDKRCYKIITSCDVDTGVALTRWINDSENYSHILKDLIED